MSTRAMSGLIAASVFVAVQVVLFRSYGTHEARVEWFTHFYVGASVALLGTAAWAAHERRRARFVVLWILVAQLVAMVPDLLFRLGVPHRMWMDAFLGHLSNRIVPGRNGTWLAVFALSLALWLVVDVWLVEHRVDRTADRRADRRADHRAPRRSAGLARRR